MQASKDDVVGRDSVGGASGAASWGEDPPPGELNRERFLVTMPVFNDWQVVTVLLGKLDEVAAGLAADLELLLVDDGSTQRPQEHLQLPALRHIRGLRILQLRRNLHHQRAIAIGLAWAAEHFEGTGVVLMDADGEDDPGHVPTLIEQSRALNHRKIVFAARSRRSETLTFVLFYRLYQAVHRVLTGHRVEVGNFSLIPAEPLKRVVVVSEIWNHYAAAVYNARIDRHLVPLSRASRLSGESTMNFTSLVVHGLSAMSVFGAVIGVRLLMVAAALAVIGLAGGLGLGAAMGTGALSASGVWMGLTVGLVVLGLFGLLAGLVVFCFLMSRLSARHRSEFVPLREYPMFVDRVYAPEPHA